MTDSLTIEQITSPATLAEGPLWDARHQRLMWVDIVAKRVHAYDPRTGEDSSLHIGQSTAALGLVHNRDDAYLLAADLQVDLLEWPSGHRSVVCELCHGVRANDGAVDPAGRYLIGTMVTNGSPEGGGALYSVATNHARVVLSGATISNGLDWSLDGSTMYYVDTPLERVDAFDYDVATGELSHRRVFVDLSEFPGRPDGLTVDGEGGVWVAMARGGAAVRRFTPSGRQERVIDLPVPHVTSVAFGGAALSELYVTTSAVGMTDQERARRPGAGALFCVNDAGVKGREAFAYRP